MPIESIELEPKIETIPNASPSVMDRIGLGVGAFVATLTLATAVSEAKPYETPEVQAKKAWRAEVKEMKRTDEFSDLTHKETARCKAQLEIEPRSYSSCIYPSKLESIKNRAEKTTKLAKWIMSHRLAQPGKEKLQDRKVLYLKNKPAEYKEMLQETQAGVFYKSPNNWMWTRVNENECRDAWNCDTKNDYYGGLQMDYDFERTYNSVAVKLWGHANNWPKASQIFAADRAYHGFWQIPKRGLGPWPSSNAELGTYPVPVHKVVGV